MVNTPMQITAYIAGSLALARPADLALDGILATQVLRRHYGNDFYMLPDPKEILYFARLPLAMRGNVMPVQEAMQTGEVWYNRGQGITDEELWYWACSSAQIVVKGRDTQHWNKRFDTQASLSDAIDFGVRVEKIVIEQGRYKAYHTPLPTLVTDNVVWYACGDVEQVAALLTDVYAMGKKRAQGNGAVLRWTVEPMVEDWSTWRDNTLMRAIPAPLVHDVTWQQRDIQYAAYRAPQWHEQNQTVCVVKGVRASGNRVS